MPRSRTKGACRLCGATFDRTGMARHLEGCLRKRASAAPAAGGKPKARHTFHLQVDGYSDYWLDLLVRADRPLDVLDRFLRDIWLECCDHMSQFTINRWRFIATPYGDRIPLDENEAMMDAPIGDVLAPAMTFTHAYDFGSTTDLSLRVVSAHWVAGDPPNVAILARNEIPVIPCGTCKKPAVYACFDCRGSNKEMVCTECAETHECGKEALWPIPNSPRCGVCGYAGPGENDPDRPTDKPRGWYLADHA